MQKNTAPVTEKKKNIVFNGVIILTLSNLLIKTIGLLFKIPITNIIGDEGMGYFNSAYRIYIWFYMISTAGLPIALSIMISESRTKGNIREVKKIYKITMILFIIIGFSGMAIMMIGSKLFAAIIDLNAVYMCIISIAPTIFFICVSSAIRGFFQGYQNMLPTAVSQIIEATGKLSLGIILAIYAVNKGYALPMVAAYSISGLTIGAGAGMMFLLAAKWRFKEDKINLENKSEQNVRASINLIMTLVKLAVPITVSASVMSLTDFIDVAIIMRRLQDIGYTEQSAAAMYGNYSALAVSMFNMPPALIYPISYSIIPLISSTLAAGATEKAVNIMKNAIKVVAIIAFPTALGLSVLAKPILSLFFRTSSAETAAPLLSVLALSVFFIGMLSVTNAILQANGYERKPIISIISGAVVKVISSAVLIGIPVINIYGAPIGTFLCYLTITVINFRFLSKYANITPAIVKVFIKPLISAVICAAAAGFSYILFEKFISAKIASVCAIAFAGIVYIIMLLLLKGVNREEIIMLPKGNKIYTVLCKLKLM